MAEEILKFTKYTFLLHFISGLIFAILFLIPQISGSIYGIAYTPETIGMSMTIGSLFLGLTMGSLFGFMANEWKEVKIVVISEIVWLVAGIIAMIINFSAYELVMAIVSIIAIGLLLVIFILCFLQQEDKMKPLF